MIYQEFFSWFAPFPHQMQISDHQTSHFGVMEKTMPQSCKKNNLYLDSQVSKGQLISKANFQAVNSSKRTNKWIHYTSIWRVSVCFLKEIEDSKKAFPNYLTFIKFDFLSLGDRRQKTSLRSLKRRQSWSIKAPIWPSP